MTSDEPNGLTILSSSKQEYPSSPDMARLETFPNRYPNRDYVIRFDCPEFTSVCPITGQPDFAHIVITYVPNLKCIESKSLKLYLFSYRNLGMFHEEITNRVLDDIVEACAPKWARVVGTMNPRGGIGIKVLAEFSEPGFNKPSIEQTM
ncbi:MAG: preQ(1) synthase [Desulfomonilaceae bacterium]